MHKELKGKVKSWTMRNDSMHVRTQSFDETGNLTSDTYNDYSVPYIYPEILGQTIRTEQEKKHDVSAVLDTSFKVKYNNIGQIIKKQFNGARKPNLDDRFTGKVLLSSTIDNVFNADGKLLSSIKVETYHETRAWNSVHHEHPTYSYKSSNKSVALFTYNEAGSILEFEYYDSDIFENVRMLYFYDSSQNMIKSLRYDSYNISSASYDDNYVDGILKKAGKANFDINGIYPDFWETGSPSKQTWTYNNNRLIEHMVFGYKKGPSFKANWKYDNDGLLLKETHHDVYHDTIRAVMKFDQCGNVVEEEHYDYWSKKTSTYFFDITYY